MIPGFLITFKVDIRMIQEHSHADSVENQPLEPYHLTREEQLLNSCLFSWDEPILDEPNVLFINGTSIASIGNISLLTGKRKSGKTTLQSLILGDKTGLITRSLPEGKNVIAYADTEQSGKYLRKLQDRIEAMSNERSENIIFYKLRQKSIQERQSLLRTIVKKPNLGVLIIDNIKDLCHDFNDNNEAGNIVSELVSLAEQYKIHIMCVLHLNKGNNQSRGHLGSELENKAQTNIEISLDNGIVTVKPSFTRDEPFESFCFVYDDKGIPRLLDRSVTSSTKSKTQKEKPNRDPTTIHEDVHAAILEDIFNTQESFKYDECWKAIKRSANKYQTPLADNISKQWLKHYMTTGLIYQDDNKKYRFKPV